MEGWNGPVRLHVFINVVTRLKRVVTNENVAQHRTSLILGNPRDLLKYARSTNLPSLQTFTIQTCEKSSHILRHIVTTASDCTTSARHHFPTADHVVSYERFMNRPKRETRNSMAMSTEYCWHKKQNDPWMSQLPRRPGF